MELMSLNLAEVVSLAMFAYAWRFCDEEAIVVGLDATWPYYVVVVHVRVR